MILATRSLYRSLTRGYKCSSAFRVKLSEMARRKKKSAREGKINITLPIRTLRMTRHDYRHQRATQVTLPHKLIGNLATCSHRLEEVSPLRQQAKSRSFKIRLYNLRSRPSLQGELEKWVPLLGVLLWLDKRPWMPKSRGFDSAVM